jgi:tetratricopeptide (TPR) repeat protein
MATRSPEGLGQRNSVDRKAEIRPGFDVYDAAISKALSSVQVWETCYARERAEAAGLVAELLTHPAERRELIACNSPRFQTWGVYERLIAESWDQTFASSEQAESLAALALRLSEHLEANYGTAAIEDLRARAWAYIGNARRTRSDLAGAGEAFRHAHTHLSQGTRDPVELALFLDLFASLLRAQRHFQLSMRLLQRAFSIYLSVGDRHRAGRILICMDYVHHQAGNPEQGIPLLYQALQLIDPAQEPLLLLCVVHNLADDLTEVGRFMEAQKIFSKSRDLYRSLPRGARSRHRWLAGRIAIGLGQDLEGERLLNAARQGFIAENAAYDVALVSFDLSALYARQGRAQELKQIAAEMVPFFSSRQIHREAAAALAYWKQAVDTETAGLDLAARVVAFLRRARYDLDLPFEVSPQG